MRELKEYEKIERSIIKTYRKELWSPFICAVKEYNLVQEGDKIAVCISGGKDSMLLAKLMQQLQRVSDVNFELVFLVMDPGYNKQNLVKIKSNAKKLNVPITVFTSNIFECTQQIDKSPCYVCARMRRGFLYAKAKEFGCNKIALGHHKSDVIETTLMSILYSGQLQAMPPMLKSKNFEGMVLIRPMYCILEKDIIKWVNHNNLSFIACACKMLEKYNLNEMNSARKETKILIDSLKSKIPEVEQHIFQSIHNVQLDTFVEYKQNGKKHSFLDNFNIK